MQALVGNIPSNHLKRVFYHLRQNGSVSRDFHRSSKLINGPKLSLTQGQCSTSNEEGLSKSGNPQEDREGLSLGMLHQLPRAVRSRGKNAGFDRLILACQSIAVPLNLSETKTSHVYHVEYDLIFPIRPSYFL